MMMETKMSRSLRLVFSGAAVFGIGMLAQPVLAQQADTTTVVPAQRVEITGSSIRRVDAETPSPVQVISAEELKQSGYTSVAQVLGNITANGQGTLSQGFSGAFAAGAQAISLRGLNSSATLVLIDGHRVAPNANFDDGQRSFVDISSIPFDTIERIEVLKDGASAQYGSDAMAGVVNIILKKSFVGTTLNAEGGGTTEGGGATLHFSAIHGWGDLDTDGYNAYVSLEYHHTNPITNASRAGHGDWTNLDFTSVGGYNWNPGIINNSRPDPIIPGSIYLYDPSAGSPSAANTQFLSGSCKSYAQLSSGGCAFKPLGVIQPETQNIDLLASFTKKLSGDWQIAVKGSIFESTVHVQNGQGSQVPFTQFINPSVGVNGASPFVVSYPQLAPSSTVTVPANYPGNNLGNPAQVIGLDPSSPNSQTRLEGKNYRLSADLTGTIGDWDTSTSVTLSRNDLLNRIIGSQNADFLGYALNRTPNPYSITGGNTAADIASLYPDNRTNLRSELGQLEFHATKSLMQLAGGDLGFSAGGSYLFTKVDSPPPSQQAAATLPGYNPGQFVQGEQSDTALFAEVAAPLTKTFELDGHARYDHFGLSGNSSSFTPSAGFKWSPTQSFALRGTLATGFRAPNVAETGKSGLVFAGGNDTVLCPDAANPKPGTPVVSCLSTPVFQTGYNVTPKLKPEKSDSATLGVILEPVKGWSSTIDLYDIKIKDQIYTPPPSVANISVRSQTPISGLCYEATGTAPCTQPGGANGILLYELAAYENTNSTEVRGFELETHYKWKLGTAGSLTTSFDWSHTMSYVLKVGGVNYQLAGTHGPELIGGDTANPKDRMQAKLTWDVGPWDITAAENYISGYDNRDPSYVGSLANPLSNTCTNNLNVYSGVQFLGYAGGVSSYPSSYCQTSSFATTDLTVRYKYSKQLVVHFAANNVFNRQPPLDAATYGGSPYLYNPSLHFGGAVGRFVQAGVTYSF